DTTEIRIQTTDARRVWCVPGQHLQDVGGMRVSEAWRYRTKMSLSSRPRRREHPNGTGQPGSIDGGVAGTEVAHGGPQRFHAVSALERRPDIWQHGKCRGPRV